MSAKMRARFRRRAGGPFLASIVSLVCQPANSPHGLALFLKEFFRNDYLPTSNRSSPNPPNADARPLIGGASWMLSCISSNVAARDVICPWTFPLGKRFAMSSSNGFAITNGAVLNDALRTLVRRTHGKRSRPTAAILDSQNVKSAGHGGRVGYDAGKRIKGRKRHLLVDYFGAGAWRGRDPTQHDRTRRGTNGFGPCVGLVHLVAHPVGGWRLHG